METRTRLELLFRELLRDAPSRFIAGSSLPPYGFIHCIAWLSRDQIVTGSADKTLRIWNLTNSTQEGVLMGTQESVSMVHSGPVFGVVTTKDGRIVTCCKDEQHPMLWDASTQELISMPSSSEEYGSAEWITLSPNEDLLATCHQRWIVFWEIEGTSIQVRKCIDTTGNSIGGSKDNIHTSACFSPDGKRIVICFDFTRLVVLDVESGERILEPIEFESIHAMIWSPDGAQLLCGHKNGSIRCVDSSTGEPIGEPWTVQRRYQREYKLDRTRVSCLAFSPDGRWLASGSYDETIRLWNVESGDPFGEPLDHGSRVEAISFSRSGEFIACGGERVKISVWRVPWWNDEEQKALNPILDLSAVPLDGPSNIPREVDVSLLDISAARRHHPHHDHSGGNPSDAPPRTQRSVLSWKWWKSLPRFVAHRSYPISMGRGPPRVYVASRDTVNSSPRSRHEQVSTASGHHESSSGESSEESTSDSTSEREVRQIGCCGLLSRGRLRATAERPPPSSGSPGSDNTSAPIPTSTQPPIQDILELSAVVRPAANTP